MALDNGLTEELGQSGVLASIGLTDFAQSLKIPKAALAKLTIQPANTDKAPTLAEANHAKEEQALGLEDQGAAGSIANIQTKNPYGGNTPEGKEKKRKDARASDDAIRQSVANLSTIPFDAEAVKSMRSYFDSNSTATQRAEIARQTQNFVDAATPEEKTAAAIIISKQHIEGGAGDLINEGTSPDEIAKAGLEATREHLIEGYLNNGLTRERAEAIVNPIINAIAESPEHSEELRATAEKSIEMFGNAKDLGADAISLSNSIEAIREARQSELSGIKPETSSKELANQANLQLQDKLTDLNDLVAERDNLEAQMNADPAVQQAFQNSFNSLEQEIALSKVELFQTIQEMEGIADELQAGITENVQHMQKAKERYYAENSTDFIMPSNSLGGKLSPQYDAVQEYNYASKQEHVLSDTLSTLQTSINMLKEAVAPEVYANLEANKDVIKKHESATQAVEALKKENSSIAKGELDTQKAESAALKSTLTKVVSGEFTAKDKLNDLLEAKNGLIKAYATKLRPEGVTEEQFKDFIEYPVSTMIGGEIPKEYMDAIKERFIKHGGKFTEDNENIKNVSTKSHETDSPELTINDAQFQIDSTPELKTRIAELAKQPFISEQDLRDELGSQGLKVSPELHDGIIKIAQNNQVNVAPMDSTTKIDNQNDRLSSFERVDPSLTNQVNAAFGNMTPEDIKIAATAPTANINEPTQEPDVVPVRSM